MYIFPSYLASIFSGIYRNVDNVLLNRRLPSGMIFRIFFFIVLCAGLEYPCRHCQQPHLYTGLVRRPSGASAYFSVIRTVRARALSSTRLFRDRYKAENSLIGPCIYWPASSSLWRDVLVLRRRHDQHGTAIYTRQRFLHIQQ